MLTVVPRERCDCPVCGSMHVQLIGRERGQIVLRCMDCRGWFGIGSPAPRRDGRRAPARPQTIASSGGKDASAGSDTGHA